jgi:hypothetical protein
MADQDGIKERLLITDAAHDVEILDARSEAINHIVEVVRKYDATFTSIGIVAGTFLYGVADDLGAGIYQRRWMPQDMDAGWWAQGLKKINEYISSTFMPMQQGTVHFGGLDDT